MQVCLCKVVRTTGLIVERLYHLDDVLMRREDVQRLDLLKFLNLLQTIELLLHALNGHGLASLEGLRGEDHREGPASLLVLQLVLVHLYQ